MDNRLAKTYGSENLSYDVEHLPAIIKWIKPNTRVLEFGPAMGYMTRFMRDKLNCNVTAVEISPEMAKIAGQYTEKIIVANLDTDNWDKQIEGFFDYIIFADVLEHLRDPQGVLQTAVSFLAKGGSVLTSIPNIGHSSVIMSLMDGEFDYQKYGLLDNTHIHFFTRKSIQEMMDACGLNTVEELNTIIRPGDTEFEIFYTNHLSAIFSILRAKDTSIYQFIHKSKLKDNSRKEQINKEYKLSLMKSIGLLLKDFNDYIRATHFRMKLPKILKKKTA